MDKKKIIEEIKKQDRAVTAMTQNGHFRIAAIRNTNTVQTAQQKHDLHHIPAFYLGKHLTVASLMASFLKGEERIIVETETNGLVKKLYSEALHAGEIRGYIDYDEKLISQDIHSEKDIIGDGLLKVQKILYNESEPFTGIVELRFRDIAADMANYYVKSEQISGVILIDSEIDENGMISNSGGLIVQQMPGAQIEEIEEMLFRLKNLKPLLNYFRENHTPDKIIKEIIPFEVEILKSIRLDFFCRCSKQSFMQKMIPLGSKEIKEMQQQNFNELVCRYCNEKYMLDDNDFRSLITEIVSKKN
jgi:molecular chaperone Hsp33